MLGHRCAVPPAAPLLVAICSVSTGEPSSSHAGPDGPRSHARGRRRHDGLRARSEIGTFLTPNSARVHDVLRLARLCDTLGYDLITFQDHPYQPALLDAPTLLAYVAAQTQHAHLSANVTNLPLRQPVVIARSATTLDLLSGGRFELGIGAGAFWDAIEAVPWPSPVSPAQSVDALEEAIRIIRVVWAVGEPGGVRVQGTTTRRSAPSAGRSRRIRSGSRLGHIDRGCCVSPAGSPTAGPPSLGRLASPAISAP